MSAPLSSKAPAGFVPIQAIAFGAVEATATPVDAANPLPTTATIVGATSVALTGTATASGSIGPFTPQLGRAIWLTLSGEWVGTVQVTRSINGGTTRLPLTAGGQPWGVLTGNCNEPVAEETVAGATYWLDVTLGSGTLAYRVQQ